MPQTQRFAWSMAAAVAAVMTLVFAALVSSWLGINAEQDGKGAVIEASRIARLVLDANARANELAALQAEFALAALRGDRVDASNPQRRAYRRVIEELRAILGTLGEAPLDDSERALLNVTGRALERFDRLDAEIIALLRREARLDRLEASAYVLESAAPLAEHIANLTRMLEARVAGRLERVAEEAGEASYQARVLLVAFGGLSLLLALLLARSLADSMAKRAELMSQLAELARVDGLTGVANRRVWDEELARGMDRARRTGQRCSVALIDLDHFKRYNDTHGHQKGDALLRDTARAIGARLRSGDLLARYGGEEFAVLLHGCDVRNALRMFERLQSAPPGGQTFSAGVADTDGRDEGSRVVARADEALYRAKAAGRNRTLAAEPPGEAAARAA
jgi:diguanylate cyclase (GGDEF)-like protein